EVYEISEIRIQAEKTREARRQQLYPSAISKKEQSIAKAATSTPPEIVKSASLLSSNCCLDPQNQLDSNDCGSSCHYLQGAIAGAWAETFTPSHCSKKW